jgi:hypothetical protein
MIHPHLEDVSHAQERQRGWVHADGPAPRHQQARDVGARRVPQPPARPPSAPPVERVTRLRPQRSRCGSSHVVRLQQQLEACVVEPGGGGEPRTGAACPVRTPEPMARVGGKEEQAAQGVASAVHT